jgi:hypothetical protein
MARPNLGAEWSSSISQLSLAYGVSETEMQQRVYALSEQIHTHYCFARGPVNHSESRPDQHIAAGILGSLAGSDWWMVRDAERALPVEAEDDSTEG